MKHLRRCPATNLRIVAGRVDGSWRCTKPAGHDGYHENLRMSVRWAFAEGSYSGLAVDHPAYNELAEPAESA